MSIQKIAEEILARRKAENTYRSLIQKGEGLIDFSSNDYLGLGKNLLLLDPTRSGSGGSRLLTGNYHAIEVLEKRLAVLTDTESALIYSSGYAANVGLLSCLPQRSDVILYDELAHASIRDGIRLGYAKAFSFKHNDWGDLESKLEKWQENEVFVVVESVYSVDGDNVDIQMIKHLYDKYRFNLIIDESHSFCLSKNDPFQEELSAISIARIVTFGKALGADGAAIVGAHWLRDFLINFSRSFIYSTAPSPHKAALINGQLDMWEQIRDVNKAPHDLKHLFLDKLQDHFELISGQYGNIVTLVLGDIARVKQYAKLLHRGGYDIRPILSPTVPEGTERLRICFHAYNTRQEVYGLISLLLEIKNEVG